MKAPTMIVALACLTIVACGGGSGETVAGIDGRGTPSPAAVVSQGAVTGFGSIVVNGVRYDTDGATFDIDGSAGTQDDLQVGDVVTVSGTISNDGTSGTATTVLFDDLVEGPVSAVDLIAGTITVLGQTVQITADTSFDDNISPASIDGVLVGMILEVSGFRVADGSISATRIEAKPAGGEFEVTGNVSGLAGTTFNIAALVVDFGSAQLDDFPSGSIENGQRVEAKGAVIGASGELIATRVEFKGNNLGANEGDQVEIEGFITRFASETDFDVSGNPVTTGSNTVFEGGSAADLGLNVKVEVEGTLDANGVLAAAKVDIRRSNQVRVTALLDSVDAATDTLVVLGITVNIDAATRLEDKSDADLRQLTLADLNAGDYVEIRGDVTSSGDDVIASILEREDPEPESSLRGFVETVANPAYTVLGVTIETTGSTVFRDANDIVISSTEFFDQLNPNDIVEANGSETSATTLSATEVEMENEF